MATYDKLLEYRERQICHYFYEIIFLILKDFQDKSAHFRMLGGLFIAQRWQKLFTRTLKYNNDNNIWWHNISS